MLKRKSIDYIFGMITGASLMVEFWAGFNGQSYIRLQLWEGLIDDTADVVRW